MLEEILFFYEGLIRNIGGVLGRKVRYVYYKKRLGKCGENVIIEEGVHFQGAKNIEISNNVWIDKQAILIAGKFEPKGRKYSEKTDLGIPKGKLKILSGVHIAPQTIVQAHGGVQIGKNVTLASGSKVYSLSHHYRNLNDLNDKNRYCFSTMAPVEDQFLIVGNVLIEDNAAIGLNAVLLPGTHIPQGTWIGSLSNPVNVKLNSNIVFSSFNK
jgi:galactoside O-acetyltransferase